jgi:hypothetical protein
MKKPLSHLHARSYFGDTDAAPVITWLNSNARPGGDRVEKLLELNGQRDVLHAEQRIGSYLARLVRATKLAVAPVLISVTPTRWQIDWRLVGRMGPAQGLAVIKLLHLADKGLLAQIRKCARRECHVWFFARFRHQLFCSAKCQQQTFRADPAWKKKHAEDMRRLRHQKRLQERHWIGRKEKGR